MVIVIDHNAERVPASGTDEDASVIVTHSEVGLLRGPHHHRNDRSRNKC